MRLAALSLLIATLALGLAACGEDDEEGAAPEQAATEARTEAKKAEPETEAKAEAPGIEITLAASEFGRMLFDSKKQAIYVFENDRRDKTVCYGECATAWPPVYTKGEPRAGDGVDASLLGTIERRDGRAQVTYAGKPLYFYAHEDPGQVLCHNVDLNGGLWWVVGPDGEPRPA
jgi:predicted lipoprotein with Yx(FWY)xxD motif